MCWGTTRGGLGLHISSPPPLPLLGLLTLVPRPSHCPFLTTCSMQKRSEKAWCPFYHVSDAIVDRGGGRGEVSTYKTVTNGVGIVNHVLLFTNFSLLLAHTSFMAFRFFSIQSEYGRSRWGWSLVLKAPPW